VQVGNQIRTLVDGGIYVNNPAVSAYTEARRDLGARSSTEGSGDEAIRVVAIGTGTNEEPIAYEDAKGWGGA
jgi:hypothetical protein